MTQETRQLIEDLLAQAQKDTLGCGCDYCGPRRQQIADALAALSGLSPEAQEIERLKAALAEKDAEIARLKDRDTVLSWSVGAKDKQITELFEAMQSAEAEVAALRAQVEAAQKSRIVEYLRRQWEWSKRTFGDRRRTLGIVDHIQKELREIVDQPHDLSEWVDVAILAMDGYWRHGGTPEQFMCDMQAKQDKNFSRVWPVPTSEDIAVEHDRSFDAARSKGSTEAGGER